MGSYRRHHRSRESLIMAAWVKRYSPLIALMFTLGTALMGLWMKAALADSNVRLSVVEEKERGIDKRIDEIRDDVKELLRRSR